MTHNFSLLSSSNFETLAADILSAIYAVNFERYGEGPDGGVDCKYVTPEGDVWVGQAKRYKDVRALISRMPKEQKKMQDQLQHPARYFLVTACSLSPDNKAAIQQAMQPFIHSTGDIYGAEDLNALLSQYPNIYRKHHQLWLHGVEQLNLYLQQANNTRIGVAHKRLAEEAEVYISPKAEQEINQQLTMHNCCLIVGDPGIGKSITAGQIALQLQLKTPNADLIWLDDRNFEQALQLVRPEVEQIIVLDDFLGATFLHNDGILDFRRDWQALLYKAQEAQGKLKLIFTTRNYILNQALAQIEDSSHSLITLLCRRVVCLEHSNAKFRADLAYSLISAANFCAEQRAMLVQEKLYWLLIETSDFSPRLLAMFINHLASLPVAELESTIKQGITGQKQLWQQGLSRLSSEAKTLLYLCALAGNYANVNELKQAFNTLYPQLCGHIASLNGFDQALIELEPTFIKTEHHLDEIWLHPANPSLIDFLHLGIIGNGPLIDALIDSLEHFDWGLRNFKISANSTNPIMLKPKQCAALISKLLELLPEKNSHLMQTYNGQSLTWINSPDTFGVKLTKLWRQVIQDPQQAKILVEKLKEQLPDIQGWPQLYLEGGMKELLDLTLYLPTEQQPGLWLLAMNNLHNSEDAASLADFYQRNKQARQVFKSTRKILNKKLLNACADEIDRTDDPDHLQAIFIDLATIETALGVDVKAEMHDIYEKIERSWIEDSYEDSESSSVYYQSPEVQDYKEQLQSQLSVIKFQVDEMFTGLID